MDKIPKADYNQVMEDDRALLSWLEDLDKFGFVLIKNAPVREGPVPALQVNNVGVNVIKNLPNYRSELLLRK